MSLIFDFANIAGGIVLGASVLNNIKGVGDEIEKAGNWLGGFQVFIGAALLVLGIIHLLRPGCTLHDVVSISAGLILLADRLQAVPGIGEYLVKASKGLAAFESIIGIAALAVGTMGLFGIHFLC